MIRLFGVLRLVAAIAIVAAIVGQFEYTAQRATINPFNFFGYFTIQCNIIALVGFAASAYFIFRGREQPRWVVYLRAIATTVIVIVGIVYNTLLAEASLAGSFDLAWSSNILHIIIPVYAIVDWLLFADRFALAFNKLWVVLIYPVVWLVVILIRGATDGWVPYPFLDPANGYGSVAVYGVVIAVFTVIVGLVVFALSRVRIVEPRSRA